jgi:hypothetical protein
MNKRLIEVLKGKDAYQRKLVQMEIEALRLVLDEEKLDEDGRQKTRRWNDKSKLAAWIASQLFERAKRCEKIQQHLDLGRRALEKFASPEAIKFLRDSGLNSHPELARIFVRIGKAMGEDRIATGNGAGGKSEQQLLAERYPKMHAST